MKRLRIVGIVVLLLVLGAWLLGRGAASVDVEPGSTLVFRVGGEYVEAAEPSLVSRLLGRGGRPFVSLLSRLTLAARDDRLDTVVLHIEDIGIGWGKGEELRAAIGRVRDAGRKTVAVLQVDGFRNPQLAYWVATAADEVYLTPGGAMPLVGLAAEPVFLGGLWENLGVDFEVAREGRYKSAVETLAGEEGSEASREMIGAILDSTQTAFETGIAQGRGVDVATVRKWIDAAPVLGRELIALGAIDGEEHVETVLDEIGAPVVEGKDHARVTPEQLGIEAKSTYALIYGTGTVTTGDRPTDSQGNPVFAAGVIEDAIEQAAEDDSVDAIVLRIDSPGGSALASERMWRAIDEARRESGKYVVASFSDVAASGGYYVASATDAIIGPATTRTGSIGVFALRPILGGLYEKLGINTELMTRGKHADFLSQTERHSEETAAKLQTSVSDIYQLFLERVAAGRSLEVGDVHTVAQGRVWTGEQAHGHGLVDRIGGLRDAVRELNRLRDLDADADALLVTYPPPKPLAQQVSDLLDMRAMATSASARDLPALLGLPEPLARVADWLVSLPAHTPLLVPPVAFDIR